MKNKKRERSQSQYLVVCNLRLYRIDYTQSDICIRMRSFPRCRRSRPIHLRHSRDAVRLYLVPYIISPRRLLYRWHCFCIKKTWNLSDPNISVVVKVNVQVEHPGDFQWTHNSLFSLKLLNRFFTETRIFCIARLHRSIFARRTDWLVCVFEFKKIYICNLNLTNIF